jgi:sec-independent protein translocase protein TatC
MSFGEHLDELRRRLILALLPPIPLFLIYFWFGAQIRSWMTWPLVRALERNQLPAQLQTLSPVETVMTDLKLGIVLALVTSAPWILWQAWCFVAPGLYRHEQRFIRFLFPASAFLTVAGVTILYVLALPLLLTMLVSFGISRGPRDIPPITLLPPTAVVGEGPHDLEATVTEEESAPRIPFRAEHPDASRPGEVYVKIPENLLCVPVAAGEEIEVLTVPMGRSTLLVQQYRLSEYISFVLLMTASVALASQMPLVILLLGWLGILNIETLRSHRKHALLICAVLAAVLTPTADMVSMVAATVPLYLLYELGVLLLWLLPASRFGGAEETPRTAIAAPRPTQPMQPVPATGTVARGTVDHDVSESPPFAPEHEDEPR